MSYPATPPSERFWSHVAVSEIGGCWEWMAYCNPEGYGMFGVRKGKTVRAPRFAYEDVVGPIPVGLVLDHLCRNTLCVNPSHLEPVSQRENILRGVGLPALNARKTHCLRGHPFVESNMYRTRRGRECRKCKLSRQAKQDAKNRNGPTGFALLTFHAATTTFTGA